MYRNNGMNNGMNNGYNNPNMQNNGMNVPNKNMQNNGMNMPNNSIPPNVQKQVTESKTKLIGDKVSELVTLINEQCPDSREREASIQRILEAAMWATASLPRIQ